MPLIIVIRRYHLVLVVPLLAFVCGICAKPVPASAGKNGMTNRPPEASVVLDVSERRSNTGIGRGHRVITFPPPAARDMDGWLPPIPAPAGRVFTQAQLMDVQGDLMIWCPEVKPVWNGDIDTITGMRRIDDRHQVPRGVEQGWVWTAVLDRYPTTYRDKIYGCIQRDGYTHVALHVAALEVGGGYHSVFPVSAEEAASYGVRLNTVVGELRARNLAPFCVGVAPGVPPAPGFDVTACPIAMNDWDNTDQADCRVDAIGAVFPRTTLLYFELPRGAILPRADACSTVQPREGRGGEWLRELRRRHPNFAGVFYELNGSASVEANVAELTRAHPFWRDVQEVLGETDTYEKFWTVRDPAAQRTFNDKLRAAAPWLRGYFSGGTSHPIAGKGTAG